MNKGMKEKKDGTRTHSPNRSSIWPYRHQSSINSHHQSYQQIFNEAHIEESTNLFHKLR